MIGGRATMCIENFYRQANAGFSSIGRNGSTN